MLPIAEKARTDPDGLALADERVRYGWAELEKLLNRATNAMRGLGLPAGGRVAVFAHNAAETVLAYNASFQAGLSSVPVNFHLTVPELVYILQDSGSKAIFVGPQTVETAVAAVADAGVDCRVIGWRCPPQPGVTAWEEWIAAAPDAEPPMDVRPAPHLHYTSGTTGIPKSAETPPAMMGVIADTMADYAIGQKERAARLAFSGPTIGIGPLYHTGPLSTVRPLLGGVAMVTRDKMDAIDFLETVQRYRCDNAVMVPTHFQRLLALPEEVRRKYDVSSFKRMAHTGAACPRDVKKAMIDWFGPVLTEAYGGTESGSTNMITSTEWLQRPGSVGKAIPPFENVIIGEDGQPLGPYEVGTIYVRDTTGRGIVYANDPAKTAAAHIAPGIFTLGEVGYLDDEGYLFITDRVSDMIVSGGVNIYPAEAEQVLILHPEVADVAVIAAPNAEMGEEVKALVIPANPESPPDPAELDRHCREHLAGYKCPRSYDFVDDIGRNAMGKVNKKALMKRYWPTDRTIGG